MTGVQTCALPICFPVTIVVLFAKGVAGGKENTCHTALSVSAVAIVPRRVEIALTLLDRPGLSDPQANHARAP